MRVVVMVKATKSSEAGEMPSAELLTAMGNYNEELVKAGVMQAGEGLHPSSKGVRVRFSGASRVVTDGPFAETNELVAGFWMWKVNTLQEAIDWVKRCPNPMTEDSEIEIRQVFSAEDFGEVFTPELREQEAGQRAKILGLDVRFENGHEMLVAGLKGSYTPENRHTIPELWARLCPHMGQVPGQVGKDTYGVCLTCEPGGKFDYLAGVEVTGVSQLPAEFTQVHLPAKRYAVFTHAGHASKIPDTIEAIWCKWLPDAGLKAAEAPAFERYTEAFDPATMTGGTEIWVPLQA